MVTRACEPTGASKSHGRVCKLRDLVLSSSIEDTVRVVDETDALRSSFFLPDPLAVATGAGRSHLSGEGAYAVVVECIKSIVLS